MTGKLTTHVLDTAHGCPAAGLTIELWRMDPPPLTTPLKTVITNGDGRTDGPLLEAPDLAVGVYELRFEIGAYFTACTVDPAIDLPSPLFLDIVPIRFGIADASAHYHVPLLCSPWAYSTYRGS